MFLCWLVEYFLRCWLVSVLTSWLVSLLASLLFPVMFIIWLFSTLTVSLNSSYVEYVVYYFMWCWLRLVEVVDVIRRASKHLPSQAKAQVRREDQSSPDVSRTTGTLISTHFYTRISTLNISTAFYRGRHNGNRRRPNYQNICRLPHRVSPLFHCLSLGNYFRISVKVEIINKLQRY